MKPPDKLGVDTAFCTGNGDDVGWDTCELECDCIFVDVVDVSGGDEDVGLGAEVVLDTEVPVAAGPVDDPAAAGPSPDGITTDSVGTAGGKGGRIIVGVSGDARETVG
jgi:hypothetical protein